MFLFAKRLIWNLNFGKNPNFADKLLNNFERFLRVQQGLGAITVEGHLKAARKFIKVTGTVFPTKEEIENYVFHFYKDKKSWSHIRNTAKSLEWWMLFLGKTIKLGRAKKPKKVVREYLSESEVAKVIEACKTLREKAIITVLAYTGIRTREICSLKISDMDTKKSLLLIREGKLFKDRIIHITKECSNLLQEYINSEKRDATDWLFINLTNERQITPSRMREMIREIAARTDLEKRIYPYIFRHSLATNLLNNGSNILTIKSELGHANLETTLIYLESNPEVYRESYLRFCPNYLNTNKRNDIVQSRMIGFARAKTNSPKDTEPKQINLNLEN